jgi:hypothetical protein
MLSGFMEELSQPSDFEWVAQVSLLRPGFLLVDGLYPEHPGLKHGLLDSFQPYSEALQLGWS